MISPIRIRRRIPPPIQTVYKCRHPRGLSQRVDNCSYSGSSMRLFVTTSFVVICAIHLALYELTVIVLSSPHSTNKAVPREVVTLQVAMSSDDYRIRTQYKDARICGPSKYGLKNPTGQIEHFVFPRIRPFRIENPLTKTPYQLCSLSPLLLLCLLSVTSLFHRFFPSKPFEDAGSNPFMDPNDDISLLDLPILEWNQHAIDFDDVLIPVDCSLFVMVLCEGGTLPSGPRLHIITRCIFLCLGCEVFFDRNVGIPILMEESTQKKLIELITEELNDESKWKLLRNIWRRKFLCFISVTALFDISFISVSYLFHIWL